MNVGASVIIRFGPMKRLQGAIEGELNATRRGPLYRAVETMAMIYRSDMQERMDRYSKGGGKWPPLAPSTIARRRKAKLAKISGLHGAAKAAHERRTRNAALGDSSAAILRDKGLLFAALNPVFAGQPGAHQQHVARGIEVGFGGGAAHPGGRATVAQIATYHNFGGANGRPPRRTILVPPTATALSAMAGVVESALVALAAVANASPATE